MQGIGVHYNVGGQGVIDQAALLDLHWGQVKGAMESLLRSFHSEDRRDNEDLEDIFEYFVQKVEFDSPLAESE